MLVKELRISEEYTKTEIEEAFKTRFGARIKGITLRRNELNEPFIILFSRADGPYADKDMVDGKFYYDGEGRDKDQELTPANKALISAEDDSRDIYGFRRDAANGKWRFLGQLQVKNHLYRLKHEYKTYGFELQAIASKTVIHKTTSTIPRLDLFILSKRFAQWRDFIAEQDGHAFHSFSRSRYFNEQEGYKSELNELGNAALDVANWNRNEIGTGSILRKVIAAIELKDNNLVFTSSHAHTRSGAPHKGLLDALEEGNTFEIETTLFDIFKDEISDADGYDELINHVGKRYGVLAYLFFLKNIRRYMPIAPEKMDIIFNDILEVNFRTSPNCSWDNFENYNTLIKQVAEFLTDIIGDDVTLIDAHSFLWTLGNHIPVESEIESTAIPFSEVSVDNNFELLPRKHNAEARASTPESIAESNHKNALCGDEGERHVRDTERQYLDDAGRSDLSKKVRIVSDNNSSLGYDVLSYTVEGEEKYIEVKSSTAKSSHQISFIITPNEYRKCKTLKNYMIYAVCGVGNNPHIKIVSQPFEGIDDLFSPVKTTNGTLAEPTNMRITLKLVPTS